MPKVLPGLSGGRLPGRSTEEAGKEEKETRTRISDDIAQEVIEGIKEKASGDEDAESTAQKNSPTKCQAKLGQLANRKRRRGGLP